MKGQKIPSLLIYIFHIGATFWGFTEQETVTGLFSKDCILPCLFPPGDDEIVHWKKGDRNVHVYYYQHDQLDRQDLDYRHRTELFYKNISSGNASLKPMNLINSLNTINLTWTDEGPYNCYVGTQLYKTEVEVMLHVRVSSYYVLEYQKTDTERMLKGYVFLTYLAPHISWIQGNTSIQETDQEISRNGVLYSLGSEQKIKNTAEPYYCHIDLPYEAWLAECKMQDHLSNMEGSGTVIPYEYSSNTANTEVFSLVWTLTKNAVTLVLASFTGTSHSYQPFQINESNFSLMMWDLTANNSGEYLCNITTPHYTKLTVRTLQVETEEGSYEHIDILEENSSLHTQTTETAAEKNKEFPYLLS
ncbi:LOW QUALITY PROTEIN: HERV-H LTR-associating protein 2 [Phaethornis superciliosus]